MLVLLALTGPIASNRHSMHTPVLAEKIVDRFVLRRPIVPYGDRIGLPLQPYSEFFSHNMPVQELQQALAFQRR